MRTLTRSLGRSSVAALTLVASLLSGRLAVADDTPIAPEERADVVTLSDGKNHYVLVLPLRIDKRKALYYSPDGKQLFEQRITTAGGEVGKRFNYLFVDPRYVEYGVFHASLDFDAGQYSMSCGERKVPLQPVTDPELKTRLGTAALTPSPRKWGPYALARDQRGNYYYVDRNRTKGMEKDFRLFAGPSGGLKQQKMTNVISDSEGDIFSTKTGSLRMIVSKKETFWIANSKQSKLTVVPVEDNLAMIYTELGVYSGQRLGTPCDDL